MKENLSNKEIDLLKELANYPRELFDKTINMVLVVVILIIVLAIFFTDYFSLIGLFLGILTIYLLVYKPMTNSSNLKKKDILLGVKYVKELRVKEKFTKKVIMNNGLNLGAEEFNTDILNFEDVLVGNKYLIEYTPNDKYILKIKKL